MIKNLKYWFLEPQKKGSFKIEKKNWDVKKTDQNVYYCSGCCKCWEYKHKGNGNYDKKYPWYLNDFPSMGKPRKKCNNCKEGATLCLALI